MYVGTHISQLNVPTYILCLSTNDCFFISEDYFKRIQPYSQLY